MFGCPSRVFLAAVTAFVVSPLVRSEDPGLKPADLKPDVVYLVRSEPGKPLLITVAPDAAPVSVLDLKAAAKPPETLMVADYTVSASLVPPISLGAANKPIMHQTAGMAVMVTITGLSQTRKQQYKRWTACTIVDDVKNTYQQVTPQMRSPLATVGLPTTRIDGQPVTDVLYFERPVGAAKEFRLQLSGENLGLPPRIQLRFSFTRDDLNRVPKAGS